MFALLKDLDWTIGEFFHHLFSHKDEDNISISRSQSHGLIVQNFLAGKTNYTVSHIIDLWMTSPYGSGTTSACVRDRNPVPRYPGRNGVITIRKSRPRENVVAHCLSILDFCKNDRARILPLCRGVLSLASCVPVDIIAINSRLGTMPSINTIKSALKGFSQQEAVVIRTRARDVSVIKDSMGRLRDPSQHPHLAASFFQILWDPAALDVLDKRKRIATNQSHLKQVGVLQFLKALTNYISEASIYRKEIYLRYRTKLAKLQLHVEKTPVNTLATRGKNEASIAELKDAFLDFFKQLGQIEGDYDCRLRLGGDGITHTDPFQSFELVRPVLQIWHLMWTDTCRICEMHWGEPLSENPATLGYSAKKIGRAAPSNLKRCWTAGELKEADKLPSFDDLLVAAESLLDTYVSPHARFQVRMDARDSAMAQTPHAPLGAPWNSPTASAPSATTERKFKTAKVSYKTPAKKKKEPPPPPPFFGDKAMVFTFAGSSHAKYTNYALEMVCDLELESNPALKDATLMSLVLNPDGFAGKFTPCDIFQEKLNKCIDPIVQRKDADYGANHVREIWSRNIKDIYDLKKDFRSGVGLAKRAGKHKKPHEWPEIKTLLREYRSTELHKRRPGRTFEDGRDVENFQAGVRSLQGGALKKWAKKRQTVRSDKYKHRCRSQQRGNGNG
ncbi:hypothetical protein B0H14DRAFT_3168007 [Mycena olivaceomarginata]|nr:hypothetical protein B0H14DRAFT_3168007 [Mycena olivaceomarginata]